MYYYKSLTPQEVSPRALILSLMSSEFSAPQAIGRLIDAAALFGIEPATLRVAVTRLIQSWKDAANRVVPWNGDWLVALTQHLGRTDRRQLRARERALGLNGYQQTATGYWVRPANLARSLADHHADLTGLGADEAPGASELSSV